MAAWMIVETAPGEEGRSLLLVPQPVSLTTVEFTAAFEGYLNGEAWRMLGGMMCNPTG
jgi:hypothetical protein